MGTALSAIWKDALEKDLGSIETLVTTTDGISQIRTWLKDHIHQYGTTYTLKQLLEKN